MAKKTKKSWLKLRFKLLPFLLFSILLGLTLFTYQVIISDKYHPVTLVGDTNISFLTQGQAIRKLQTVFQKRNQQKLTFSYPQGNFTIDIATSSASLDYSLLSSSSSIIHKDSFFNLLKLQLQTLIFTNKISPNISLSLDQQLDTISSAVNVAAQNAKLEFNETTTQEASPSTKIQIKEGKNGLGLDRESVKNEVINYLLSGHYNSSLPIKSISPKVTTERVQKAKEVLEESISSPIKLTFNPSTGSASSLQASSGQASWTIDTKQLLALLDLETDSANLLDKDKTSSFLKKLASEIDQNVQEGLFEFNPNTKRVSAFKPSQEGRKLDIDKTYQALLDSLNTPGPKNVNLPVAVVKPKIQTSDVNSLGIKELLGRGVSNFAGSIPNRIYNVGLTASKISGVLIPPGETFSFNQTVGDITAATGFKQAYVIKEGRTVLDDGGGVCQDSTTLFRAVLNAGLPVIKRTAHAYRVGYYEQGFPPGLDATVFYPSVDFQFKNDTLFSILIQAYTSGLTLYVDLYGTSDGRASTISKSIVTNQTPPPAELRQDDPTLPKGTVKQVDFPAWGATVTFNRTVKRGSETLIQETFKSNYKAWQAIYLVGTKEN